MFKVLITDPISEKGIEILKREPDIEVDNEPDISYDELLHLKYKNHGKLFKLMWEIYLNDS